MNEYIEKDRARMFICGMCNEIHSDDPCEPSECAWMDSLERESTVIVPVRHGRWIDIVPKDDKRWNWDFILKCSECGKMYTDDRFKYCPNCGAQMCLEDEDHG